LLSAAPLLKGTPGPLKRYPLAMFKSQPGPIRLQRAKGEYSVYLPMSLRNPWRAATLHLAVTNSMALVGQRSTLAILLNGQTVAQERLDGKVPRTTMDIPLPVGMLKPDFNKLTFRIAEHYVLQGCEDPFAPELWTEVDPTRSTLDVVAVPQALNPRLADLNELFSPKDSGSRVVNLVSAEAATKSDNALEIGGMITQGVALRLQYLPLTVKSVPPSLQNRFRPYRRFPNLDQDALKKADTILFGLQRELSPYLDPEIARKIQGPFLGVYPLDADPTKLVVVIAGRTLAEEKEAATAFAFLNIPFPESAEAVVNQIQYPSWEDYSARDAIKVNRNYTFSDLGLRNKTLDGYNGEALDLNFSAPPDLLARDTNKVIVHLHFSSGAGLRKDSAVNVFLNDIMETAILLDQDHGAVFDDYRVQIPARALRPGSNTLTFIPHFLPSQGGDCLPQAADNLIMTVFADSWIEMPRVPHLIEMPNLSVLSRTGFPYTVKTDGSDTCLWVTSRDQDSVGAAWTLMGRLAQTTGAPMFRSLASFAPAQLNRNLLVVGPISRIPASLAGAAPVSLAPYLMATYPSQLLEGRRPAIASFFPWTREATADGTPDPALSLRAPVGSLMVGTQFRSPFQAHKTVTLFTANRPDQVLAGMSGLVQPVAWDNLSGNLALWNWGLEKLYCQLTGHGYEVGQAGPNERLLDWMSRYPLPTIALFVGLAVLLAGVLQALITRRLRTAHAGRVQDGRL
jgi:hypothetical protein